MSRKNAIGGLRIISWASIVALVFVGVVAAPRHTGAQVPGMVVVPFSADGTIVTKDKSGNPQTMSLKLFVGKGRMRMEMNLGGRGNMAWIINSETNNAIILMLDQKMAMDLSSLGGRGGPINGPKPAFDFTKRFDPDHPCTSMSDTTCTLVGNETVNGRDCQKWVFVHKPANGTTTTSTAWFDSRIRFPIKAVSEDSSFDLRNVVEGAPPDTLFGIPPDFKVIDPSAMMGRGGRN